MSFPSFVVRKISYKFVEPETRVVALKVVKLESPDAVIELNKGDETTFIIGSFAVPPVIMFEPGCTLVMSFIAFNVTVSPVKNNILVPADNVLN
jgi:hypothetical protein